MEVSLEWVSERVNKGFSEVSEVKPSFERSCSCRTYPRLASVREAVVEVDHSLAP